MQRCFYFNNIQLLAAGIKICFNYVNKYLQLRTEKSGPNCKSYGIFGGTKQQKWTRFYLILQINILLFSAKIHIFCFL